MYGVTLETICLAHIYYVQIYHLIHWGLSRWSWLSSTNSIHFSKVSDCTPIVQGFRVFNSDSYIIVFFSKINDKYTHKIRKLVKNNKILEYSPLFKIERNDVWHCLITMYLHFFGAVYRIIYSLLPLGAQSRSRVTQLIRDCWCLWHLFSCLQTAIYMWHHNIMTSCRY